MDVLRGSNRCAHRRLRSSRILASCIAINSFAVLRFGSLSAIATKNATPPNAAMAANPRPMMVTIWVSPLLRYLQLTILFLRDLSHLLFTAAAPCVLGLVLVVNPASIQPKAQRVRP
ncbi:hypothetical protein LCGC14_2181430 [marine sediment metagenome]|uniref:Uncharacterized protein n=1 Tax=marine sediment metagenome TaxID=412755 RepID=A0A0F9FZR0_9ZZZZ